MSSYPLSRQPSDPLPTRCVGRKLGARRLVADGGRTTGPTSPPASRVSVALSVTSILLTSFERPRDTYDFHHWSQCRRILQLSDQIPQLNPLVVRQGTLPSKEQKLVA